jgi:N-methylhydantoinase A
MTISDPILKIGVDIGGTFTDVVGLTGSGRLFEAKVPSNKARPDLALRGGLEDLSRHSGDASVQEMLGSAETVVQGTTVALNAVLQGRGARTALLCTEGFRDTLEIRLGQKDERYRFDHQPPEPLVPRHLRIPIRERVDKNGAIRTPLREDDVRTAAARLAEEAIEAVAICFLWSFSNAEHEQRAAELLQQELGSAFITTSSEVLPRIREYDRVSTTVLNAYVGPTVARYVDQTEGMLRQLGFYGRVRYVQSNGGQAESGEVLRRPVALLMSGPAAAPAAGRQFVDLLGEDFITIDMGGTSFETCLVRQQLPEMRARGEIAGYRVAAPAVDVHTIGAGGGSIATLHEGLVSVGPQSAEAYPGPACYARGGDRPTLTDANVVCGVLDPDALLGGRFEIDATLSTAAIERHIAEPARADVRSVAAGIIQLSTQNMSDAIRHITIQRGHDPRNYSLLVGGGAGGVHATALATDLGIKRVVVPRVASELCAFGAVVADLRHDYTRSYVGSLRSLDLSAVAALFEDMEAEGREALRAEGAVDGDMSFIRSVDLRYKNQVWEVTVDVSDVELRGHPGAVETRFHARHAELYGFSEPESATELISLTLTAIARSTRVVKAPSDETSAAGDGARPGRRRHVLFGRDMEPIESPVLVPEEIPGGEWIPGPAVIEERNTTILVGPGWRAKLLIPEAAYVLEQSTHTNGGPQ